jgi:DNA-directed RNA polymerase subunit RPC12/RpoP
MPMILKVQNFEKIKKESPQDELLGRTWWIYECVACGDRVLSDIHYSFPLHCLECGGDMPSDSDLPYHTGEKS